MSDAALDQSIQLDTEWTPDLLNEVFWLNMTAIKSRDRTRSRLMLLAMAVAAIASLAILVSPTSEIIPHNLVWFVLGLLVMRAIVIFVHIPAMNRRRIKRAMLSPLLRGPRSIKLSNEGIAIDQALSFARFNWPAVNEAQEEALALHLLVGEAQSIPIPFDSLPADVTREDLLRRVKQWRESAP